MAENYSGRLDSLTSNRIKVVRVIAILMVTLVHLQPGLRPILDAPPGVDLLRFFAINVLGYASVPVLSVISGYLFLSFSPERDWTAYVVQRFRMLYLPLVFWSAALALMVITLHQLGLPTSIYDRLMELPVSDSIFAISDRPINYPLYFLRDIFVISLFFPILIRLGKTGCLFLLAFALFLFVADLGQPVLLRPMTLLFFAFGMTARAHRIDPTIIDRLTPFLFVIASLFWVFMWYEVYVKWNLDSPFDRLKYLDFVNRILVALLLWGLSGPIARSRSYPLIARMEPRIYLVFLTHVLTITVFGGSFLMFFGTYASYMYVGLLLATPVVCYITASVIWQLITAMPSFIQVLATGKPSA